MAALRARASVPELKCQYSWEPGLDDPFDPEAAIDAEARMMSGLLRHFGSVRLALAAYNAGSGAVDACGCIPPYPETIAYVARILAPLDGSGALLSPPFEVRLIT